MTHDELLALIDREVFTIVSVNDPSDIEIARLRRLKVALRAVVELHKPMTGGNYRSDTPQCSYCRSLCHSRSGLHCEDDGDGLWPCDTIQAIEKELK